MFASIRPAFFLAAIALGAACVAHAQSAVAPTPAPLPSQLFTARKVFLSNASGETSGGAAASRLTYDGFYGALKSWGRYQLTATPADADLILEIRYETPLGPANGGNALQFPEIRLTLSDPKTRVILWAFCEPLVSKKHESNEQHLNDTLANLLSDLQQLTTPATS
jgi:hypothetical protein